MGSVSAATNARIEWNLKFRPKWFGNFSNALTEEWSPPSNLYNSLACFVNAYLKLVGDSGKHYYIGMSGPATFLTYTANSSVGSYEWIESGTTASPSVPSQMNTNLKRVSTGHYVNYAIWSQLPSGSGVTTISGSSVAGFVGLVVRL